MKVLYANPIFLDYRIPLFKRLDELFNGEFHVLYSPKRYERRFPKVLNKINNSIPSITHPFTGDYIFNTKTMSFKKFSYYGKNITFTFGLIRRIIKFSPKIVITEGFLGWTPMILIYGILFKRKIIVHYERTCHTERNTPWYITLQRKIFNYFIHSYLVNGTETKKYLNSIGITDNKIFLAGMSADTKIKEMVDKLTPKEKEEIEKQYHKNFKGLLFLYVGRLSKAKGVDRLINAWEKHIKQYPHDQLILAGDGELIDIYKNNKHKSIQILGRVDYDSIYKLYAIADVFIIATLQDNWSLVVPEAMSCGIPVATSIYNGCHTDLIKEEETGFTFDSYNDKDIEKKIALFHRYDLTRMGENAIVTEKKFGIEETAQRIYNTLTKI